MPFRPNFNRSSAPKRTPLSATQALIPAPGNYIRGVGPDVWFSPLQPIPPVAPRETGVRQWDYPIGANIDYTPRSEDGAIGFDMLRGMADSCYLLRAVIERLKAKISAIPWVVRPVRQKNESASAFKRRTTEDRDSDLIANFFRYPDGQHSWSEFIRLWLEELLVCDAAPIWLRRAHGQKTIEGLVCVSGSTITRLLDEQGMTPAPPDPAYQQILYGLPATNLTSNDLIYTMMCERAWRRYGFSIAESIFVAIGIALKRQDFQLKFYTSGNMPEGLVFLPGELPPSRVKELQGWYDSILMGESSRRRGLIFVPGSSTGEKDARPNVVFPKINEMSISDHTDEWLAKVICFRLGISPQDLVKMMNRAVVDEAKNSSEEEGARPIIELIDATMTRIIQRHLGYPLYEFVHEVMPEVDPEKQQAILVAYTGSAIMTINEGREKLGLDPDPSPEANMLGIKTANGFVPLSSADAAKLPPRQPAPGQHALPPAPDGDDPAGGDGNQNGGGTGPAKESKKKIEKAGLPESTLPISLPSVAAISVAPQAELIIASFSRAIYSRLSVALEDALEAAAQVLKAPAPAKAAPSASQLEKKMYAAAQSQMRNLYDEAKSSMEMAALLGVSEAMGLVPSIVHISPMQQANAAAHEYAVARGAELVGMKMVDGVLVPNPYAKWKITEEIRHKIREAVSDAMQTDTPMKALREDIQESGAFSSERADMIARTEVKRAMTQGNLALWKESGVVEAKQWTVAQSPCVECLELDGKSVPINEDFEPMVQGPPLHPNCMCSLVPGKIKGVDQ